MFLNKRPTMICLANFEEKIVNYVHIRETNRHTDRETEDVVEAVCGEVEEGQRVGWGGGGKRKQTDKQNDS